MSKAVLSRYAKTASLLTSLPTPRLRAPCFLCAALAGVVAGQALIVVLTGVGALAGEATRNWNPVVKYAGKKEPAGKPRKMPATIKPATATPSVAAKPKPRKKLVRRRPLVRKTELTRTYCENIADAAADARFAWQKSELEKLQVDLNDRLTKLTARTSELKTWLKRRKAYARKAQTRLIKIYAGMRPDVAALQLAAMDEVTASALLSGLKPRAASTILNEMKPKRAARLTSIIAGAARVEPKSKAGGATKGSGK